MNARTIKALVGHFRKQGAIEVTVGEVCVKYAAPPEVASSKPKAAPQEDYDDDPLWDHIHGQGDVT